MPDPIKRVDSKSKMTKMQAFRFDGSRSVRITCQLEICEKECNPVACSMNNQQMESMGKRRKRDVDLMNDAIVELRRPHRSSFSEKIETERYTIPRLSHAITSLTIVDNAIQHDVGTTYHAHSEHSVHGASQDVQLEQQVFTIPPGRMCLDRMTFASIFLILGGLTSVQAIVVVVYLTRRLS
jgi:hypothetical protein